MGANSRVILDGQRRIARSILVGLVMAVVTFALFASGPNIGLSFAQQTAQFKISFLNPSGHSEEISAKDDGTGASYHLVAWVDGLPSNAGVVFSYTRGGVETEIGTATQTGIPDTFAYNWEIPASLTDGPITLHAILYSGQTEMARDTEADLVLNNAEPTPGGSETEARGETVELTYPAVGGAFGFYEPRDEPAVGVPEVRFSTAAQQPRTTNVRVFYTTTAPGNEPAWNTCGTETVAAAADGVRCTLPLGLDPSRVTALGALANDTPAGGFQATFNDSGDAHRVSPYDQIASSASITPPSQGGIAAATCSGTLTVGVRDQHNFPIADANVDVHALGPSDQLAFSDDGQPPELAHRKEAARDCSGSPPANSGEQGEHENTTGNDLKHIETVAGTTDDGLFAFQMFNPTAGGTQLTAWVDGDADDVFCSNEVNASSAIGWQEPAPGVVGVSAETSNCPGPSPSSPNPGPTTPGPSPSASESPDPRGCTITGTPGSEQIDGTPGSDIICAGDGDDIIRGLGADDTIYGEGGRDDVRGGAGDDAVSGGADKDTLRGNGGRDRVYGEDDNDVLTGGSGDDLMSGGGGFDTMRGSGGNDRITGQGGNDNLTGGGGRDTLNGGPGKDAMAGGPGRDGCIGGGGRDSFNGCETRRG